MAASFHLVGYSKSSSSSAAVGLAVEFGRDVFSSATTTGAAASVAALDAGRTVSTAPLGSLPSVFWTLGVAVFSESAMLDGRRLLFGSLIETSESVRARVWCLFCQREVSVDEVSRTVDEDDATGKSTDKREGYTSSYMSHSSAGAKKES